MKPQEKKGNFSLWMGIVGMLILTLSFTRRLFLGEIANNETLAFGLGLILTGVFAAVINILDKIGDN